MDNFRNSTKPNNHAVGRVYGGVYVNSQKNDPAVVGLVFICLDCVVKALKALEDSRSVFEMAAEMDSAVLREVAQLMGVKHNHIMILSAICRAWTQCVAG